MGQYYMPCLLENDYETNEKPVIGALYSHKFGSGLKLMEHSWVGNNFVKAVTYMLLGNETNPFVWCGDYADCINNERNMYDYACQDDFDDKYSEKFIADHPDLDKEADLKYIINHSKEQYVVIEDENENEDDWQIHPLPLLTADGCFRGGGDYPSDGENADYVGIWAYDIIECNDNAPEGYEEIFVKFKENE